MAKICSMTTFVFALSLWTSASGQAQVGALAKDFAIDANRPFVYLKIGHMGKGIPDRENEPATRIWLRLTNNCKVPIVVSTFGVPDGSPEDEVGLMYEIVPEKDNLVFFLSRPEPIIAPGTTGEVQKEPPTPVLEELPIGTMFDVGSSTIIPPGRTILFSAPVNHFGRRWHIEIPFRFDLPQGRGPRDPNAWGGEPSMVVRFSFWDLPRNYQAAIEKGQDQSPARK